VELTSKSSEEKKSLGLFGAMVQGLAYMAPGLSLLATFVLVYRTGFTYNATSLAYLIAGTAIILTAISFAELVKAFPTRGSVWDFVNGTTANPRLGQFSVWIYVLGVLVAPAAAFIPVGFYFSDWLGFPSWITVLIGVIGVVAIVSVGIKLSIRLMAVLFALELGILLFFAFASIQWSMNNASFAHLSTLALSPEGSISGWGGVMAGATIAIYCFLGFESPATLVEEAKNGKKTIPIAIVLTAVAGTILYTFLAWAYTLATPSIGPLTLYYGIVNPLPIIGRGVLGGPWFGILNFTGIVAGITCAIAATTAASRLLSKLGSDKVFPSQLNIHSLRFGTPIVAILVASVLALILAEFVPWEIIAFLLPAAALPSFIIVNLTSFWRYKKDGFTPKNMVVHGIVPWLGIGLCSWFVLMGLPAHMQMLLSLWVILGAMVMFAAWTLEKPRVSRKPQIGLGISCVALVSFFAWWLLWYPDYSGGALWWHHFLPYASVGIVAQGTVVLVSIILLAALVYIALRHRRALD
jgi:amino acid transporter